MKPHINIDGELVIKLRILLVDGMAFLYRAFHSSKRDKSGRYHIARNSRGEPINALTRYLYIIDAFNREYPCDEIIICEDAPRDTLYRQQLFAEYKQGRTPPPQELLDQKGILFGFLRKIGFPVIGLTGYEADDIIGTMSKSLSEDGHFVLIASPDKDMYQLLTNDRIAMIQHNTNTKTQQMYYRDDIYSQFGYWPEQVIDLKVLSGDASDNIPGVPRCGYKNAIKLLQKYKSIEKMINSNIPIEETLDDSVKTYIIDHMNEIKMYRSVLTINRDIDPTEISKQLAYTIDRATMEQTMKRYEVISYEDFSNLSYSDYIYERISRKG
jgi:DNA polymerase-1